MARLAQLFAGEVVLASVRHARHSGLGSAAQQTHQAMFVRGRHCKHLPPHAAQGTVAADSLIHKFALGVRTTESMFI